VRFIYTHTALHNVVALIPLITGDGSKVRRLECVSEPHIGKRPLQFAFKHLDVGPVLSRGS
jgi:hypothetical protein